MFLDNDNTTEYFKIIEEAQTIDHQRSKKDFSYEDHHIIPSSLGGVNAKKNRVILTLENHYICHSLLIDMVEGNDRFKMLHAWSLMNSTRDIDGFILIGPDRYAKYKQELSELLSKKYQRSDNPNSKRVYQLDTQGNFMKLWDCVKDATDKYSGDISACARGDQKTSSGFIWVFEDDYCEERVNELKILNKQYQFLNPDSILKHAVYSISLNNAIESFASLTEASELTTINKNGISRCIRGLQKTAGKRRWYKPKGEQND